MIIIDILKTHTEDDLNQLMTKFNTVVDNYFPKTSIGEQLIIFNLSYNHISLTHVDISTTIKAWCLYVVRKKYDLKEITTEEELKEHIDLFIEHYNNNYNAYVENIDSYCSEFDRDISFINSYLDKTNTTIKSSNALLLESNV